MGIEGLQAFAQGLDEQGRAGSHALDSHLPLGREVGAGLMVINDAHAGGFPHSLESNQRLGVHQCNAFNGLVGQIPHFVKRKFTAVKIQVSPNVAVEAARQNRERSLIQQ
jgi:hypothetical protein